MKVIDLLNKIANGEEVPKKIKYHDKIYNYEEFNIGYGKDYFNAEWIIEKGYRHTTSNNSYIYLNINDYHLNDEVEIIEESQPTEEEINEYTNKFLEVWKPISKQFGELFDELIRIKNDLGLNLEENTKEPQEHKIPEKIEYHQVRKNEVEVDYIEDGIVKHFCLNKKQRYFADKINEIIDYLEEIENE